MIIETNGNEKSINKKRTLLRIVWITCVLFGLAGLSASPWWGYLLIFGFLVLMFQSLRHVETDNPVIGPAT